MPRQLAVEDDALISIFKRISSRDDRRSFAQVSKQCLRVACICQPKNLHILLPDMLHSVLPQTPNLVSLGCSKPLSNTHLKLLASSCRKLQYLELSLSDSAIAPVNDFDDDGLCAVANGCRDLLQVSLRRRPRVGDVGVAALVTSCKKLKYLYLDGCNVTDKSLEAIAEESSCLVNLSLRGCYSITDLGLEHLANGNSKKLETLDLSLLPNIDDWVVCYLAEAFSWLRDIYLTGCDGITGKCLWDLTLHESLQYVELFSCENISWKYLKAFLSIPKHHLSVGLSRKVKMLTSKNFDESHIVWN